MEDMLSYPPVSSSGAASISSIALSLIHIYAISGCRIMPEVMGSDHCPVCLELDEGMMAAPVHEEAMNMHTISV